VSKALGQSTLEMTKKYASLEVQRLRSIVDGAQMVQIDDMRKIKDTEK
jgi:hypothetical protein